MDKLHRIEQEINTKVLEKAELVRGLILGALTGQHLLVTGPPGTGKSMVVHEFFRRLDGGKSFTYLINSFTRPEELLGPISLQGLERDEYYRVLRGKAADAHFVFLDEVFLAGSGCMNSLLTLMNERKVFNGAGSHQVPLIMLVGACNHYPAGQSDWQAFADRFLIRFQTSFLEQNHNLTALIQPGSEQGEMLTGFTLAELGGWQIEAGNVRLSTSIIEKLIGLLKYLRSKGLLISDRRFKESVKVLKASAYLNQRHTAVEEDLQVLQHLWWQKPEDKVIILEALSEINLPYRDKAQELLDRAKAIALRINTMESRARLMAVANDSNLQLTEIYEELLELKKNRVGEDGWLGELTQQVEELHAHVVQKCLGINRVELH